MRDSGASVGCDQELGLQPLALEHLPQLDVFLRRFPHSLSGYTAACLWAWNEIYRYQWALLDPQTLLICCQLPQQEQRALLQPIGWLGEASAERLLRALHTFDRPLRLVGVDQAFVDGHPAFAAAFAVEHDRANDNYLYWAEDLAKLSGRNYSKKRNHIAQALRFHQVEVEPISAANVAGCEEVMAALSGEEPGESSETYSLDEAALCAALRSWGALGLSGVLVKAAGRPAGFSIFEEQTPDTAVVHFERALRQFKGLYQVVNRAVAQIILERGYRMINREEDLGLPGLRQAKESYHPSGLAKALQLTLK